MIHEPLDGSYPPDIEFITMDDWHSIVSDFNNNPQSGMQFVYDYGLTLINKEGKHVKPQPIRVGTNFTGVFTWSAVE